MLRVCLYYYLAITCLFLLEVQLSVQALKVDLYT